MNSSPRNCRNERPRTIRAVYFIASFFPNPTGATYSAIRLARTLRDKGASVSFIVNDCGPEWRTGGDYEGFPVRSFRLQNPGKMQKIHALFRLTWHLLAQRSGFDLFHIHGGGHVNLFLAWWVRLIIRRPTLLKITSDGWDTPEGMSAQKWGAFSLFAYRRASGIVAMTGGQAEKCRAWKLPAKIAVIPNGVDCARYHPVDAAEKIRLRDELQIPRDAFVLVYVGWLGHGKGTDVLLEIWRTLHARDEKIFLLLVGDYLNGSGFTVPASPAIRTVGRVDDAERYLMASDLFVFPSRREGFGTVQIEAMACGLTCIVIDLPGVSSDIFPDDSCGFRIAGNRVEDYVGKITRLRNDPALRETMGRAARARTAENFSVASVADRYLALYRELLPQADHP